jgi:hypothetical protein
LQNQQIKTLGKEYQDFINIADDLVDSLSEKWASCAKAHHAEIGPYEEAYKRVKKKQVDALLKASRYSGAGDKELHKGLVQPTSAEMASKGKPEEVDLGKHAVDKLPLANPIELGKKILKIPSLKKIIKKRKEARKKLDNWRAVVEHAKKELDDAIKRLEPQRLSCECKSSNALVSSWKAATKTNKGHKTSLQEFADKSCPTQDSPKECAEGIATTLSKHVKTDQQVKKAAAWLLLNRAKCEKGMGQGKGNGKAVSHLPGKLFDLVLLQRLTQGAEKPASTATSESMDQVQHVAEEEVSPVSPWASQSPDSVIRE